MHEQSVREVGTIVKWLPEKGYGFITHEGTSDVWFHASAVEAGDANIQLGMGAEFLMIEDARGRLRAVDVTLQAAGVMPWEGGDRQ